ncbi:MAG: class I SAM-dependent methyltransferase [Pseudomonadota bacterium]
MKSWKSIAGSVLLALIPLQLPAQEGVGDVVYVPTPQVVVDEMLQMAKVGPKDFIIDLGSGDGRMVITAAKKFGARGFGVDLDPVLLKLSNENARREGVADRARFVEENLFTTDLSQATVITSYLLPEMNEKLRPKILNLRPGTRVVAHDYHMGEWHADEMRTLDVPEKKVGNPGKSYVYRYIVPAKIAGRWQSQFTSGTHPANLEFDFEQRFQMFDGVALSGGRKITLRVPKLEGDQLSFQFFTKPGDNATRHEFKGTVKGDLIDGTLRLGAGAGQKQVPWSAKLVKRAASPE